MENKRRFGTLSVTLVLAAIALGAAACGGGTSSGDKTATARAGAAPATAAAPTSAATKAATGSAAAGSPQAGTAVATSAGAAGKSIDVTEKDFAIGLAPATASAGSVTFSITNNGPSVHEFVVFKTDLAPDKLPQDTDNHKVNEDGAGLTKVDEVESIDSGGTGKLTVTLTPGKYVVICNIAAHYEQGMHAGFTVQ